ncbi:putative homeodomain-interacting protein kinase 1-like [Scophthalmus maximus]|uniref:Putative homeodomain-interacting protein kinase 1-like n=1 Tax=Scophthalmus maximus TaxID=52904 RepID=A0A2U9BY73_SCOMX|nr:putative homeodomain-interacting protein kinase 1-like [Scophthalmus maximus]
MALQISSTVPAQDDLLVPGTWLTCNYKVQSFLGEGTFGKVTKCVRMVDNRTGAIKVIKKSSTYEKQADAEVVVTTVDDEDVSCCSSSRSGNRVEEDFSTTVRQPNTAHRASGSITGELNNNQCAGSLQRSFWVIDMWSLGCMAAAMYLGTVLYPGRSEYDMMRYIVETQGQPRHHMLNPGLKTCTFFQRDSITTHWKLKQPPSRTANQLNSPPHAERSSVVQPNCIRAHRCTSNQTTKSDWSALKRKVDVGHENKNIQSRQTKRSHTDMTFHHRITRNPSKSTSSLKRKMTDGDDTGCKKTKSDFCEKSDNDRKRPHKKTLLVHPPQAAAAQTGVSPRASTGIWLMRDTLTTSDPPAAAMIPTALSMYNVIGGSAWLIMTGRGSAKALLV